MNGRQDELMEDLQSICDREYDGDRTKMILDILVVIGYWAELKADE
jgi:hypothetical protein